VSVTIRDKKRDEEDLLEIEVKDTGIGMDEEMQKHIFEKYNQSDNQEYTKKSIE
jgi:signal transduction histidine kinase